MNAHAVLLLTADRDFEKTVTEALDESVGGIIVARSVGKALEIGCRRGSELDLAIIDRSDCHAITLLSAIKTCRRELPIVVVTSGARCHCTALAQASGAAACIAKPISAADLRVLLNQLCQPKLELTAA